MRSLYADIGAALRGNEPLIRSRRRHMHQHARRQGMGHRTVAHTAAAVEGTHAVRGMVPEGLDGYIRSEIGKWSQVIKSADIRVSE